MLNQQAIRLKRSSSFNDTFVEVHSVDGMSILDGFNQQRRPAEENLCRRTLLEIVAKGNAIITELQRLVELVPQPFRHIQTRPTVAQIIDSDERSTYDDLICDFSYFKIAEQFESTIESNQSLKRADEIFCDTYSDILTRFYLTFESIHRYARDLNGFIDDLGDEIFVGQSLEILLSDQRDIQLLCEAYFVLGFMLITIDNNFEGGLRERLIISYYRYSSYKSSPSSKLDETCNLMRSTGFRTKQQQIFKTFRPVIYNRPRGYPESFFERVGVNVSLVSLLIAKLQTADIYNQTVSSYQHPDHRSTALAQQSSMLYTILYFCPDILCNSRSRMREISNRFFYDNWFINVHLGELVNLFEAWDPYPAARDSLVQLYELSHISFLAQQHHAKLNQLSEIIRDYLKEGWLTENTVLDHHAKILNHIRESNITLRWLMLQSNSTSGGHTKFSKAVYALLKDHIPNYATLYKFLQDVAELEWKFSIKYSRLLERKDFLIQDNLVKAREALNELVAIFSGVRPMRWVQKDANPRLVCLLVEQLNKLNTIDLSLDNSRDLIINLIYEIESSRDSYSDGKNLQVAQLFTETRDSLLRVMRSLVLSDDMKTVLHSITDFSYGWKMVRDTFTAHMQDVIQKDPLMVYGIEAIFVKLSSAFNNYILRIQQVNSDADLLSVSHYYSTKLVSYVRDVLQIIPSKILELVSSIITIQTEHVMNDLPSRISMDSLKNYMLTDERYKLLELTYKISHYAESMLMWQGTTMGIIEVNSKQLLEDGIRRELADKIDNSIQTILEIGEARKIDTNSRLAIQLTKKLRKLHTILDAYRRCFEYIQDYLYIYGSRMWQEQLNRAVKQAVDQTMRILIDESCFNGSYVHSFKTSQAKTSSSSSENAPLRSNFIMKILDEILTVTDPRATIYDEQMRAWFDQKPQRETVLNLEMFELIASTLSVACLNGVDQVCRNLLMMEIKRMGYYFEELPTNLSAKILIDTVNLIGDLDRGSNEEAKVSKHSASSRSFLTLLPKIAPHNDKILSHILRIGQLQIIRSNISQVLTRQSRSEASDLYRCLETLNKSLLSELKHGGQLIQQKRSNVKSESSYYRLSAEELSSENSNQITNSTNGAQAWRTSSLSGAEDTTNCYGLGNANILDESQLMFELSCHLDWVGLSDPMSKVYVSAFEKSIPIGVQASELGDQQIMVTDILFLVILDQCSKFEFSLATSGLIPKQSKSFYETSSNVDSLPFFYGLVTIINHLQPQLCTSTDNANSDPLEMLIKRMSLYSGCAFSDQKSTNNLRPQDLTQELINMILSMIEIIRLSRCKHQRVLAETYLPEFVYDTFQSTAYHLSSESHKEGRFRS